MRNHGGVQAWQLTHELLSPILGPNPSSITYCLVSMSRLLSLFIPWFFPSVKWEKLQQIEFI
jgi:hypothetical protein